MLPEIEAALAPFEPRPHWGKLSTMDPGVVRSHYAHLPAFADLANANDPTGTFRNAFTDRYVFGGPVTRRSREWWAILDSNQ